MKNIPLKGNNVSLFVYMLSPALLWDLQAISCLNNMPEMFPYFYLFFYFKTTEFSKVKRIKPSLLRLLLSPLCLADTLLETHLTDQSEGVFTHQGGPYHPPHKSHPGAWSVYGSRWMLRGCVCVSVNINRGVFHMMWPVVLLR